MSSPESFLDILLEAKGKSKKKTLKIPQEENDQDDYLSELDDDEGDESTVGEEGEVEPSEDDETTDYTEEEDEVEPSEDDQEDEESTDYTDTGDNLDGDQPEDNQNDETNEESNDDREKNRVLINDFIKIYNLIKNSIEKISEIDKTDIFINKITTQVILNLTQLKKIVFDYVTYKFPKTNYVNNLYQFNYFIEAIKINIEMLKKLNVLGINYKTNI